MALTNLKKVFSLFSLVTLAILYSSFNVASLSVNEVAEIDALLNWKASLQNETQSPLPSWTLLTNNATNSLMKALVDGLVHPSTRGEETYITKAPMGGLVRPSTHR